ncbi:MAG: EscU/YscU/HrcU family type III secretion system export apparatus switch protein [Bacteroidota bacterium]
MADRRLVPYQKKNVSTEIASIAREYGIPLEEAEGIARSLGIQDVDATVPPELFRAVAEVMAFVYQLDQFSDQKRR